MNEATSIITYKTLLQELEGNKNHLLLGNGFNNSLGVATDYKSVFKRMLKDEATYKKIEEQIESKHYDIEKLIDLLKNCLKQEDSDTCQFLNFYIKRKVKFDFMRAASSIVRENIKEIYQEKNQGIYLLFKNFTNYFSLNYDTFLYLLLMKFKKNEKGQACAFQNTILFQKQDLDQTQNNIYQIIQKARKEGKVEITIENESTQTDLKIATKGYFQAEMEQYNKREKMGWKQKDIKKVCDQIWEEEKGNQKLKQIGDGFSGELFLNEEYQNIFFLHGSFHIYEDKKYIRKITQKQNKAMHKRLEEIIQADEEDVICILANQSDEKQRQINDNEYLKKCFEKLSDLSGNIVILGSSLSENDKHIFQEINKSDVKKVYISSGKPEEKNNKKRADKFFPKKEVTLFDYTTISYAGNEETA